MKDDELEQFVLADSGTPAYMAVVECQRCHANTTPIEVWATGLCRPCDNCGWPNEDKR